MSRLQSAFHVAVGAAEPQALPAAAGGAPAASISAFLTTQSFTNFAAMTGAILAAWHVLQLLSPVCASHWVPFIFAMVWAAVSVGTSWKGLKTRGELGAGGVAQAVVVALLNGLVLAGAVIGTTAPH